MRRLVLILFLVGLCSRLILTLGLQEYQEPIRSEQRNIAVSIIKGQGYANPYYSLPTGPTALLPPVYTMLFAGVFYAFGTESGGELARHILNASAAALAYALLPLVAQGLMLPVRAGILAALAGNLLPVHYRVELHGGEPAFAALALVCLFLFTVRAWRKERLTGKTGVFHGLAWGSGLLIAPSLLPIGIAWSIVGFWRLWLKLLPYVATLAGTALLVLLPWTIRNTLVLGSPVLLRSNLGLELQISNNELALPVAADAMRYGAYREYHPVNNVVQATEALRLGEVEYNRRKLQQAIAWIWENRREFLWLTAQRALFFWFPRTEHFAQGVVIWALTALAFLGLAMRPSPMIISIWVAYPALYYLVHIDNRYRYLLLWTLLVFAAFAVDRVADKLRQRFGPRVEEQAGQPAS